MKQSISRALSLGILAGMVAVPTALPAWADANSDEMIIDTPKVYTRSDNPPGYWVEYQHKKYKKQVVTQGGVETGSRWAVEEDQIFSDALGGNYQLTTAQRVALENSKYMDAFGGNSGWDANSWYGVHNLNTDKLKGAVNDFAKLLTADISDIADSLIPLGVQYYGGGGQQCGQTYGCNQEYVFNAQDGTHTIGYRHGVAGLIYTDPAQQAAYSRIAGMSYQQAFAQDPADIKLLAHSSQFEPLLEAIRLQNLADLVSGGLPLPNDFVLNIPDIKVPQGDLAINETAASLNSGSSSNPNLNAANNLRTLAQQLWTTMSYTHSPIVLDLNHDGKIGVTGLSTAKHRSGKTAFVPQGAVWFDLTGEGKRRHVEWLNGDSDGFLVWDPDNRIEQAAAGNGEIDARSLFGDAVGYQHGYHKLVAMMGSVDVAAVLRDNATDWAAVFRKAGPVKGNALKNLRVWINAHRDGKVHRGEIKTLDALGITEIGTGPTLKFNKDHELLIQSYFVQNGKRYLTEDVWFAEDPKRETR